MRFRVLSPFRSVAFMGGLLCLSLWGSSYIAPWYDAYAQGNSTHGEHAAHAHDENAEKPKTVTITPPPSPLTLQFTLTNHQRVPVTEKSLLGKVSVVFYGFTNCPMICPTGLATITAALSQLSPSVQSQVQPLFITLDPERDTPARLKEYLSMYSPALQGLTGTLSEVDQAAKSLKVYYTRQKKDTSDMSYNVDHTTHIYILNRQGVVAGIAPLNVPADQLAAYIQKVSEGM